jgi:hypothetical protein
LPEKFSIFGRVHAARSYIGSQSWFLANIVPPDSEALKRFVALLWAYVQNSNLLKADSDQHYSPWASKTLIQEPAKGGLNAQDFTGTLLLNFQHSMQSGFLNF